MSKYFVNRYAGMNDPNYLHYWWENVEEDAGLSNLHNLINQSSQDVIKQNLDRLNAAKMELLSNSGLNAEDENTVAMLLDGTFFTGLDSQPVFDNTVDTSYFDLNSALNYAVAQESLSKIQSAADYQTAFQDFIDAVYSQNGLNNLWQSYAEEVIQEYMKTSGAPRNQIASKIIQSVLNKNANQIFVTNFRKKANVSNMIAQISMLLYALPDAPDYAAALNSNSDSHLKNLMLRKFSGWTSVLRGVAAEHAFSMATLNANQQLFQRLKDVNATIKHTGSSTTQVTFTPDLEQEEMLGKIDKAKSRIRGKRVNKADVSFVVGEGNVTASIGVTVKDVKPTETEDGTQKVRIRLQNNTPLLTLLMREAGFSGNQMRDILQIAVAHEASNTGALNEEWQNLMEFVTYTAMLDALSGLHLENKVYYMVINNHMYSLDTILQHLSNTMRNGSQAYLKQTVGIGKRSGLTRAAYSSRNRWEQPAGSPNTAAAEERSRKVYDTTLKNMNAVKVSVNMDLAEYILLNQSSLVF